MSSIKRLTTTLVLAGAVAAPAASAAPASDPINVPDPVAVVQAPAPPSNSFDWGDAGIGAGGALVVALLAAGGVATLRHRALGALSRPS